jgi:hypothetical protein
VVTAYVGGYWDISAPIDWPRHFWSPHMAITRVACSPPSSIPILTTRSDAPLRDVSPHLGLSDLGAFISAWRSRDARPAPSMMVAQRMARRQDHQPAHMVLAAGFFGIEFERQLLLAFMNRSDPTCAVASKPLYVGGMSFANRCS